MDEVDSLTLKELGRRLKISRRAANIRQETAAECIRLSRPSIVAIESGTRTVRINELQKLSKLYGVTVNSLLRQKAIHVDLVTQFRKTVNSHSEFERHAHEILVRLVKADVELDNTLGLSILRNYPPERGIANGEVKKLAKLHALELRDWLDIGKGPVSDLFSLIEFDIGIRLYQRRLHSSISGLYAYDDSVGACMLLNSNHTIQRRVFSACHELGHFVGTRRLADCLYKKGNNKSREERYADAFAYEFLTPQQSFENAFKRLTEASASLTRRHVILLAHQFHISAQACVYRLEDLSLVRNGTWKWFLSNGGITNLQAKAVLGENLETIDESTTDALKPVPHKIGLKAHMAWKSELLSEETLSDLLDLDRIVLRGMLYEIENEETENNDLLNITRT